MSDPAISAELLRALRYVELVERGGGRLTTHQIDAYVRAPLPSETTGWAGGWDTLYVLTGMQKRDYAAYMKALGWLRGDVRVKLTEIGRAIVKAHTEPESNSGEGEAVTVLYPEDPMNLLTLTGAISSAKSGLLVDPYFKDGHFPWLVNSTSISRVLLCRKSSERGVIELAVGGALASGRELEVRCLPPKEVHDRYLIAEDGAVSIMGISLTGVQRHFSVIAPVPEPGAGAVRTFVEEHWRRAEPVMAKAALADD